MDLTAIDHLGSDDSHPWGIFECHDSHHEPVEIQGLDDHATPDTYAWWRLWNHALTGNQTAIDGLAMLRSDAPTEFDLICFMLSPGDYPPGGTDD